MPATKGIEDSQYLALMREGLSPTQICHKLGIQYGSSAKQRIARLCGAYGITTESLCKTGEKLEKEQKLFRIHDRERIVSLNIENGIILVGTDPHYSRLEHVSVAHKAFCNVLSDLRSEIRGVVLNGDIADFSGPSRFPRGPWRNPVKPKIKDELEAVQQRCSEIEENAPKGAFFLRTLGNHDDRMEAKLSASMPEIEGLPGTRLRDHIPRWTECERIDVNEELEFIHDIRKGEFSRDRQNVLASGHHVVVGHSHQLHVWAQTWRRGVYFGVCAGTLCDLDDDVFHYLGSRPANWQSGFVVLIWRDGVLQYPELAAVIDGKVYFRGKRYA